MAKIKNPYFSKDTENAILEYVAESDQLKRDIIYRTRIDFAFHKLVENLIHKYKFYHYEVSYEDSKHEVIAFYIEKLGKFNPSSGKAFSYFHIVGRNYLIAKNKKNYDSKKNKEDLTIIDESRNIPNEISNSDNKSELQLFFNYFIKYCDENLNYMFSKKREIQIADSVIQIFRGRENIEDFNKKAIYIMVREMTDATTHDITKVVNILKEKFYELYSEYKIKN